MVSVHVPLCLCLQVAEVKLPLINKASSRLLSDPKFKGLSVHVPVCFYLQVAEVKLPLMTKASSRLLSDPKFKGLRDDMAAWRK